MPDAEVAWNDVWPWALASAILFTVGKLAIAWYIGSQGLESTHSAAASIVALLIWVYYSAQIVLFGAEISHAYSRGCCSRPDSDRAPPAGADGHPSRRACYR
jgi:membrane protein